MLKERGDGLFRRMKEVCCGEILFLLFHFLYDIHTEFQRWIVLQRAQGALALEIRILLPVEDASVNASQSLIEFGY